ncbi:MAG: TauD/TfdA family dioxygenase, partial [Novosphingobium sp.]|nr:TauD/TfdA family dioxygenase [Novosphingobium sp.]
MTKLVIAPIAGALGAEISGVDLSKPLDAQTIAEIRQALLDHLVIFFRDQQLDCESYMRFARYFGTPVEYPLVPGIEGWPEITEIVKLEHERNNFGGIWHADTTYLPEPPMGTMLYALEVPPHGGDTLFANQYLAYESLSEGLRKCLDGLTIVNTSAKADVSKTREDVIRNAGIGSPALDHASEH